MVQRTKGRPSGLGQAAPKQFLEKRKISLDVERLIRKVVFNEPHILGNSLGFTKLQPLHSKWIVSMWDTKQTINAIQAHRGSFKTSAITVIGIVRQLFIYPNSRIAIIRKSYTEAAAIAGIVRAFMRSVVMRDLFEAVYGIAPREVRKKESSITWNFKTTDSKEGSLDSYGIGTNITGAHYDDIVLCDIITLDDRISEAEREKTIEYMREIITNVLDPGARLVHEGTPWHKKDGWILTPPMPHMKFPVDRVGLLTPEDIAYKKKYTTDVLYNCNYELTHIAASDMIFQDPNHALAEPWKNSYAHVDAKYAGQHTGAYTVMQLRRDKKIQAFGQLFYDDFSKASSGDATAISDVAIRIAKDCSKRYVRKIFIESNADKGFGEKELQRAIDRLAKDGIITHKPLVEGYFESTNKDIKIQTYGKRYWERILWSTITDPEYLEQVIDYMDGQEPNDAPDSMSSLQRQWLHPEDGGSRYGYLYS